MALTTRHAPNVFISRAQTNGAHYKRAAGAWHLAPCVATCCSPKQLYTKRRLLHAKRCSPCAAHCYYARQNVLIMCSPTRQIKGWHRAKWAQLCLLRTSSAHWGCSCPLYSTHTKTITVTLCADTACYYYTPWINGRVPRTKTTGETVLTIRAKRCSP